jgi:hypothetical protein
MLKDLKAHEKDALKFQIGELLEHDETSAILATLHRVAERKAYSCAKARDFAAALNWQELADALASVRAALVLAERHRAHVTDI